MSSIRLRIRAPNWLSARSISERWSESRTNISSLFLRTPETLGIFSLSPLGSKAHCLSVGRVARERAPPGIEPGRVRFTVGRQTPLQFGNFGFQCRQSLFN